MAIQFPRFGKKRPTLTSSMYNRSTAVPMEPPGMAEIQQSITALKMPDNTGTKGSFDVGDLRLTDKDDLTLDHDANKWEVDPKEQPEEATRVVNYVKEQFDTAYRARQEMELEWAQALAFFEGRQWFRINSQTRNLVQLQNPAEPNRYVTVNKMRPLIDGVVGKLTQVAPDARAVPLSQNPKDQAAADEANFIAGHYTRKFDRETQTKERVRWACITGTSFVKIYWKANADIIVPKMSIDDGSIKGYESLPLGDVEEEIIPCFNMMIDPTAQRDADVRWMIHASIKPLSWFTDNYGEAGKAVSPDAIAGQNAGYVDAYLEGANGSGNGWVQPSSARLNNIDSRKHCAIVYEYWERPTAQYENGRYIVSTNRALLYAGDWPYKKKDTFPFIPLRWQPRSGTPYGHSLCFDLCPLQQTYNRIYSRWLEQFETNKDYLMIERLSRVGADAFDKAGDDLDDNSRIYRKVYYDRGAHPPQIMRAPGISQDLIPFMQSLEKDMADIAGLHDVSQGQAPAGTPAEAVTLLQRADNTQHSYIRADIEISISKIKEWEIALVDQYAITPFIGSVDDQINPRNEIKQGVITFDQIREGGQFRIVYVPGSSMHDTPEQKMQKILLLRQMGLFGDPQDADTNALAVKMLQLPETSDILEVLGLYKMKQEQMQQQAMELQQQQIQAQMAPKQEAFNPEAEQMRSQLDLQKQLALQEAKTQGDLMKIQAQTAATGEQYAQKHVADIANSVISGTDRNTPKPPSGKSTKSGVLK